MTEPAIGHEGADRHWPEELDAAYELRGELGRGGMAVVFRARDRELGREVAIKIVRPRFSVDQEAVARLTREARTVALLEHPNIVGLYSIKHLSDGGVALVMQLVPGRTLKQALEDDGPFPVERAEAVLRDIARALAYAHRAGVIHRDVKPQNIFLDDISGRALLSDFGVARVMDAPTELTATGTTIGTPTYMSPEQIDGGALDGRSDLYSLGLVGWEMLTGERPWAGENLYTVIYRQKHDPLPPIDLYRTDVPPRLQYLIEGLMHKNPDRRWSSAARFLKLLSSDEPPPGFRDWQLAQRRRRRAAVYTETRRRGGSIVEAALETVKFARGQVLDAAQAAATAANGGTLPLPGAGRDTAETEPPPRSRKKLLAVLAMGAVVALGTTAALLVREGLQRDRGELARGVQTPGNSDEPGVELPVLSQAPDSTVARDSAAAVARGAGGRDTAQRRVPLAAIARDSSASAQQQRRTDAQQLAVNPESARSPIRDAALPAATNSVGVDSARPLPTTIAFPAERGIVAAGGLHSCLLREDSRALCWGNNERGQLGDGTFESRARPVPVTGDFSFAQIAGGGQHSCGLTPAGDILCWGNNESGQLGDGTSSVRAAPVRVNSTAQFRVVRTGQAHSCGLTRTGAVLCWGANSYGQLGDGTHATRLSPVTVQLPGPAATLAAGWNHSCAILQDGSAYCWGRNDSGQLGDGTTSDRAAPVAVATDDRLVSIAAGNGHTCAVSTTGVGFCWGRNQYGQLGIGEFGGSYATPRAVALGAPLATVAAGSVHSCGRARDGRIWCWGRNANGQLGDGTRQDRATPVPVRGAPLAALQAGGAHSCGVTASGEAFCWGYNTDGQLGTGDRENSPAPARVVITPR